MGRSAGHSGGMTNFFRLAAIAALTASSAQAGDSALISSGFIYETAPFPSCHASTLCESGGTLVAAWFGGTDEQAPDVCIYASRREDGKWTVPQNVADGVQPDGTRHPTWNPVLYQPEKGPLQLYYKAGPSPSSWWGMMKTSPDNGKTWSAATRLPDGILGPIKNKPVLLQDGTLLSGSSTEHAGWKVHFEWSADSGVTWKKTAPLGYAAEDTGGIQPTIFQLKDGSLLTLCRPKTGNRIVQATGKSATEWGPISTTTLPNPGSGIDGVKLADGRLLLIYNHSGTRKVRSPLNLALSSDEGKTWQAAMTLESEKGEYSYPAIIQTPDGKVHASWTWKRERIRHAVIDPAALKPQPFAADGAWPAGK